MPARPQLSTLDSATFPVAAWKPLLEHEIDTVGADGFELVFAAPLEDIADVFGSCRADQQQIIVYPQTISRYASTQTEAAAIARGVVRHEALHGALGVHSAAAYELRAELGRKAPEQLMMFNRLRNVLEDGFIEQTDAARDPDGHRAIAVAYALIRARTGVQASQIPCMQAQRALAQMIRPSGLVPADPPPAAVAAFDIAAAGTAGGPEERAVAAWRCLDVFRAAGLADIEGTTGPPLPLPGRLSRLQLAPVLLAAQTPASAAEVEAALSSLAAELALPAVSLAPAL